MTRKKRRNAVPEERAARVVPDAGTVTSSARLGELGREHQFRYIREHLPEGKGAYTTKGGKAVGTAALRSPKPKHAPSLVEHDKATDELIRDLFNAAPFDVVLDRVKAYVVEANRSDRVLEALALSGERAKPRIESVSGPSWSTEEAGGVLSYTAETIRTYIARDRLVGYTAAGDRTRLRVPRWQFDGPVVHEWVPRLIEAFGDNGWPLLDFVTVARSHLGGASYLQLLLAGRAEEVIAAARRTNPG